MASGASTGIQPESKDLTIFECNFFLEYDGNIVWEDILGYIGTLYGHIVKNLAIPSGHQTNG